VTMAVNFSSGRWCADRVCLFDMIYRKNSGMTNV